MTIHEEVSRLAYIAAERYFTMGKMGEALPTDPWLDKLIRATVARLASPQMRSEIGNMTKINFDEIQQGDLLRVEFGGTVITGIAHMLMESTYRTKTVKRWLSPDHIILLTEMQARWESTSIYLLERNEAWLAIERGEVAELLVDGAWERYFAAGDPIYFMPASGLLMGILNPRQNPKDAARIKGVVRRTIQEN